MYEDLESLRPGEPLLVERNRYEALADAGEHLLTALNAVIGYAKCRADGLQEMADQSGDAGDFARWLRAERRWIQRLRS